MFYAHLALTKKGKLAKVWLAAHWEKKLSKAHVFETDIQSTVANIISPEQRIALRTSSHLLLGIVRIYYRKTKYLLADCTEALIKIKMSFRPEAVDLPLDNQKAPVSAITLPEFQEWDAMIDNLGKFDYTLNLKKNQCRVEDITMKEDSINTKRFLSDDNFFGDTPFGETNREVMRDEDTINQSIDFQANISKLDETANKSYQLLTSKSIRDLELDESMMIDDGGFGPGEGLDFLEGIGMNGDNMTGLNEVQITGLDDLDNHVTLDSIDTTITNMKKSLDKTIDAVENIGAMNQDDSVAQEQPTELATGVESTMFTRDIEALALDPIEETIQGKDKRRKRKRKLVIDDEKIIDNAKMKAQLNSYEDLVKKATVAPPTRMRMTLFDSSVKTLYSLPTFFKFSKNLLKIYTRNLTSSVPENLILPSSQDDEVQLEEPTEILRQSKTLDQLPNINDITDVEKTIDQEEYINDFVQQINPEVVDEEFPELLHVPPPFIEEPYKTFDEENITKDFEDEDETEEKQDEQIMKRWTKRSQQTVHLLAKCMKKSSNVNFKDLVKNCNRKQAALKFYTLLTLNKEKAITIKQEGLFSDIIIGRGVNFIECS
ncbi:double-strand-break repair protein rad21 homolog isoform X1 [Hydra vulgaris]|uniref:Double-strand-break repair protein rad21 homolog n=1 Tax=Hydra vulgaris TaxID=6087 RepID=T2MIH8_HYDVU|nr:double-strand-break repair protein rad21 homolog [Hydra vulgaris]